MGVRRIRSWAIVFVVLFVALSVLQCTAKRQIVKEDDETVLRRRVQEYWSLKIKGDLDKCYEFEVPPYREKVNVVDYLRSQGRVLRWTDAEVRGIEMDGTDKAKVEGFIKFRYQIPQFRIDKGESSVSEMWVKVKGKWYHVPSGFAYQ